VKNTVDGAAEHRQTALEAARQGIVMLKNTGVLPLDASRPARFFVVGPNADSQTILGDWAAPQKDEDVVTVLEGLRTAFPLASIDTLCFGGKISNVDKAGIRTAHQKAAAADISIVVVGDNSQRYSAFGRTCGENCDRDDLDLPGLQEELLEAVHSSGKPTVLVLMSGRALSVGWAKENIPAILNVWEPGQMGGQAIAEIISGAVNPSGKLPVTIPRNVGQVQTVYNYKHSQYSRLFATSQTGALWPFGHGLSYSSFRFGEPRFEGSCNQGSVSLSELPLKVAVDIFNDSETAGTEVVQLYIRDEYGSVTRPVKELKAFRRVDVAAGGREVVEFEITEDMLKCWGASEKWKAEPGDFTILIGSSSDDADLQALPMKLE
jgi:Glycosyl hydrolase family 3 C terminal domain.